MKRNIGFITVITLCLFALNKHVNANNEEQTSSLNYAISCSEIILKAKIISVGPKPDYWTGKSSAIQSVIYDVELSYKGNISSNNIMVKYLIVKNSKLVNKKEPGLDDKIFYIGAEQILLLQMRNGWYFTIDENNGAFPYTQENENIILMCSGYKTD